MSSHKNMKQVIAKGRNSKKSDFVCTVRKYYVLAALVLLHYTFMLFFSHFFPLFCVRMKQPTYTNIGATIR